MDMRKLVIVLCLASSIRLDAHEFPGHAEHQHGVTTAVGTELYVGKRGYLHAGAGVSTALNSKVSIELGTHLAREDAGAKEVPSFEAEVVWEPAPDLEIEIFGFGYPQIERRQAWGVGVRATKRFALQDGWSIAPFFGPVHAQVRAESEETGELATVGHTLLLGGATIEFGPCSITVVGSHSFYDREPTGFETPVDFESMSHFAAYENNDGFPRNTVAVEIAWKASRWLTLHARYAALQFEEETRHAIAFTPAIKLSEQVEFTAGFQLLRDGEVENDLAFGGLSVSF